MTESALARIGAISDVTGAIAAIRDLELQLERRTESVQQYEELATESNVVNLAYPNFNGPYIDARRYGLRYTAPGDISQAEYNVAVIKSMMDSLHATGLGAQVRFPPGRHGECVYVGDVPQYFDIAIPVPPFTSLHIDCDLRRTSTAKGRFIGLSQFNRVTIHGSLSGEPRVDMLRPPGAQLIYLTPGVYGVLDAGYIWIEECNIGSGYFFAVNLRGHHLWVRHNSIKNNTGSVKADSEPGQKEISGINCDAVHFVNCSHGWIAHNYIEAIDDCTAWTCLNNIGAETDCENINVLYNTGFLRKGTPAAPGLGAGGISGTMSKYSGGGFRCTEEAGFGAGITLRHVHHIGNKWFNGQFGVVMTNLDITDFRSRDNQYTDIHAASVDPMDYNAPNFAIRGAVLTAAAGRNTEFENETIRHTGLSPVRIASGTSLPLINARFRNIKIYDFNTDYSGAAISGTKDRAAFQIFGDSNHNIDGLLIEHCEGDGIDGGWMFCSKNTLPSQFLKFRLRYNEAWNINTSGQVDQLSAGYALRCGIGGQDVEILEDVGNKIHGFQLPVAGLATERLHWHQQSNSVFADVSRWTADMAGAGKDFAPVGTMALSFVPVLQRVNDVVRCQAAAANDELRTPPLNTPWQGRAQKVYVMVYLAAGSLQINNAQYSFTINAEALPRWRVFRIIFGSHMDADVRLRFIAIGGAADWYLGRIWAPLENA